MKTEAMVMRRTGGPEVLERATIELAEPGPGEVRVRVRAAALNHLDVWTRRGLPHLTYDFPHRLCADVAGEVDALGPGTDGPPPGTRVVVAPGVSCGACARCARGEDNLCKRYGILGENLQGGSSRHLVVPARNLLPYPGDLPFTEAAAVPLVFMTAWQMVVEKIRVVPGQTVLVNAAGSGVSAAAIQILKLFGARVLATTSSTAKVERARALGADEVIVTSEEDLVARVKALTGKRGADAVIEHVGGELFTKSLLATAWGGTIATCGATSGFRPDVDLRHVFFRQVTIAGSTMASRAVLYPILEHVAAGRLRPVVDRVLPLWDAAEAHRVLEAREAFGKVVLEVPALEVAPVLGGRRRERADLPLLREQELEGLAGMIRAIFRPVGDGHRIGGVVEERAARDVGEARQELLPDEVDGDVGLRDVAGDAEHVPGLAAERRARGRLLVLRGEAALAGLEDVEDDALERGALPARALRTGVEEGVAGGDAEGLREPVFELGEPFEADEGERHGRTLPPRQDAGGSTRTPRFVVCLRPCSAARPSSSWASA